MSTGWWATKLVGNTPSPQTAAPTYTPRPLQHAQNPSLPPVPQVTPPPANLTEALARGVPSKGGDGAKAGENMRCPMCGGNNYFSNRTNGSAPRCFECGHTTQFPMQGAPPA